MTRYNLSEENYKLMKNLDFSEMGDSLKFDDKTHSFETSDDELLLTIITENIAAFGMDESQDNCTEYGWALYTLHDEILYGEALNG